MAHIAMVVPVWIGHLNPMTTLGRELQRRGHDVSVLSFPAAAERVHRAGLNHETIGETTFPPGEWERRTLELSRLRGLRAARYTIHWIAGITHVMLSELAETVSRQRFDGIVADQVCFGAECAAETAGVPLVIACNALPVHFQPDIPVHTQTWPWKTDRFSQYRNRLVQQLLLFVARSVFRPIQQDLAAKGRTWNQRHHLNEIPPSLAHVAQLPACLDFPRRHAPDHFHHTGPWHEAGTANEAGFEWDWLDGRPLVYASLGTLQNGLDHLYQLILDACADLPLQVVLTLGRENGARPQRIPANARVLGYGPQVALLKRASMVITHGGMNTVLEALAQGLPLVALPIANDQPGIAARIRHTGVGDWVPLRRLSPALLRATVQRIRTDPVYQLKARECAKQLGGNDGAQVAAMVIEEAFLKRQRVIRSNAVRGLAAC